jgi:hypothetical protein
VLSSDALTRSIIHYAFGVTCAILVDCALLLLSRLTQTSMAKGGGSGVSGQCRSGASKNTKQLGGVGRPLTHVKASILEEVAATGEFFISTAGIRLI